MNQTPLGTEPAPPLTTDSIDSRDSFVFLDKRGKRWPRFRRLMFAGGLLFFIATILFIQTLVLPSFLVMPPAVEQLKSRIKALQEKKLANNQATATKPLWLDYAKKHKSTTVDVSAHDEQRYQPASPPKKESMAISPDGTKEIRLGFYESWDPGQF